jgi:hypothetical protein
MARRFGLRTARLGALAASVAGCSLVNAFSELPPEKNGGGAASAASAAAGGSAPSTVGPGPGATGGGVTTAGGVVTPSGGGDGGAPCSLLTPGTCGLGLKCSVIDPVTGAVGCVQAGGRPAFAKCSADPECAALTWCDHETRVCKPLCASANDCPNPKSSCIEARWRDEKLIPGLHTCTAHCDPEKTSPCDDAYGPVTCYLNVAEYDFDCAASSNLPNGAMCSAAWDCADGHACADEKCRPWCSPPEFLSPDCSPTSCLPLSPKVTYEGNEYGLCGN